MAGDKQKSLWDEVAGWLTGTADSAIREAEDLTRRGRLKMEMMRLSRDIEKVMARLGGRVYRLIESGEDALTTDDEVVKLAAELRELEAELKQRRAEYEAEKKKKRR